MSPPSRPRLVDELAPTAGAKSAPISPELGLIDPKLAAAARALLLGPGRFRPAWHEGAAATSALRARLPLVTRPRVLVRRTRRATFVACAIATAAITAGGLASAPAGWHLPTWQRPAHPAPPPPVQTRAARQTQAARVYSWPAVPGAQAYKVKILRGRESIYEATTSAPTLELPEELKLSPGRYTWSATPQFKPGSSRAARPVIEETFEVSTRSGT